MYLEACQQGIDNLEVYEGHINKKEAVKHGIKILTYNCDCDKDIDRVSCYESDQYEAGKLAAKAMGKALHKKGKIAIVVGERVVELNKVRYDSFVKYIKNHYHDIEIVETIEVLNDPERTYQQICDCLNTSRRELLQLPSIMMPLPRDIIQSF